MQRTTTTIAALAIAAAGLLSGCAGGDSSPPPAPPLSAGQPFDFATYTEMVTGHRPGTAVPASWTDLMLAPAPDPSEDDAAFDCREHGNRICGPGNPDGYPAGLYGSDGITLIDAWPVDATIDVPDLGVPVPHIGSGAQPGPAS